MIKVVRKHLYDYCIHLLWLSHQTFQHQLVVKGSRVPSSWGGTWKNEWDEWPTLRLQASKNFYWYTRIISCLLSSTTVAVITDVASNIIKPPISQTLTLRSPCHSKMKFLCWGCTGELRPWLRCIFPNLPGSRSSVSITGMVVSLLPWTCLGEGDE